MFHIVNKDGLFLKLSRRYCRPSWVARPSQAARFASRASAVWVLGVRPELSLYDAQVIPGRSA